MSAQQELTVPNGTLSGRAAEVLRTAVNLARDHQIGSVQDLRNRLNLLYPGGEAEIKEAIQFWANDIARRHPQGVPHY